MNILRIASLVVIIVLISISCKKSAPLDDPDVVPVDSTFTHAEILKKMNQDYEQMPEKQIAVNNDSSMYAQYTLPTERYKHGALGDFIEAGQLVVYYNHQFYTLTLPEQYVFEDIRPRIFDVNNDRIPEIICICSHVQKGAGIVVYSLLKNQLVEYATVSEIGMSSRWLNIAAIHDMDKDGIPELLWVETPHIGGILKGTKITPGKMEPSDEAKYFSNHQGGSHNLCLSVLTNENGKILCYVPNQNRSSITGFSFLNGKLKVEKTIEQSIDFTIPLFNQVLYEESTPESINCIY